MKPTGVVHLLTGDVDLLRRVLDDIDEQLVSFGVAPDHRSITELAPATLRQRVEQSANGADPEAAITNELVAAAGVETHAEPVGYARLTGTAVLCRIVTEETPGHEQVAVQCDKCSGGFVTEYTVYQFDEARGGYTTYAHTNGVFEV